MAGDRWAASRAGATTFAYAMATYFIGQYVSSQFASTASTSAQTASSLSATGIAVKVILHALAGGIHAKASGGSVQDGALAAGVSAFVSGKGWAGPSGEMSTQGLIVSALVGGTVSRLSGGKFANGAFYGFMTYILNQAMEKDEQKQRIEKLMGGSAADRQKAIELSVAYFGIDTSAAKSVKYSGKDGYGFANEVGEVWIGKDTFANQLLSELGSTIWHEVSHQVEMGLRGDTSFTNHVAIYEMEARLEAHFGGYSATMRADSLSNLRTNLEYAEAYEPKLINSYLNGSFGSGRGYFAGLRGVVE